MKCMHAAGLLDDHIRWRSSTDQRELVSAHLMKCSDCRSAAEALQILHLQKSRPVPGPRPGLFARALRVAGEQSHNPAVGGKPRFWLGAAFGGALAAGIAIAALALAPLFQTTATDSVAEMAIALHETRDANIAIDTPVAIADVEIRVVLSGAIALDGFEGRDELRWTTSLDSGANKLRLPIRMQGRGGGHLLVEVTYGNQRKAFAVALRDSEPSEEAGSAA